MKYGEILMKLGRLGEIGRNVLAFGHLLEIALTKENRRTPKNCPFLGFRQSWLTDAALPWVRAEYQRSPEYCNMDTVLRVARVLRVGIGRRPVRWRRGTRVGRERTRAERGSGGLGRGLGRRGQRQTVNTDVIMRSPRHKSVYALSPQYGLSDTRVSGSLTYPQTRLLLLRVTTLTSVHTASKRLYDYRGAPMRSGAAVLVLDPPSPPRGRVLHPPIASASTGFT